RLPGGELVRLRRHDLHALASVYALNAIDDPERQAFERHLRRCRSCEAEIRGLEETATGLAMAVAEPPPADLRSRVMAATAVTRQLPPVTAALPGGERRTAGQRRAAGHRRVQAPWVPWLASGLAAACLVIAVAFGVAGISARHSLNDAQAQNRAIAAVLAAPDARTFSQPTSTGGTATLVVSRARDAMVVTTSGLRPLPASKVYQMWFIGPSRVRSAGLLPAASAGGLTAPVAASGLQAGDQIGMTVEPAGGTSQPTTKPIVLISLTG
ncbi:MAG: anti-sigma factor, partial [Actinobacteria bacterium]|nr:anti-sigma factor [Actinomycetota bacterium]